MTDAEDKTGSRRQGWPNAIPLVTLLGVVFGAGVGWAQLYALSAKVKEFTDKSDARIQKLEEKSIERGAADATVAPMVNACAKVISERSKR